MLRAPDERLRAAPNRRPGRLATSLLALAVARAVMALVPSPPGEGVKAIGRPLAAAPVDATDIVFAVLGEGQPAQLGGSHPLALSRIADELKLIRPDFAVLTGDMISGSGGSAADVEAEYAALEALFARSGVPVFAVPGENEVAGLPTANAPSQDVKRDSNPREAAFRRRFGSRYGSFDFAGIHAILLDTQDLAEYSAISDRQWSWLEADLEGHRQSRALLVFLHAPVFSSPLLTEAERRVAPPLAGGSRLHELLRRHNVKAVFAGHQRLFWHDQRDGIDYFISGGAGAPAQVPPDRGGFSNYIVAEVITVKTVGHSGQIVKYSTVEPYRLDVRDLNVTANSARSVVNANYDGIPLRGIALEFPASLAQCGDAGIGVRGASMVSEVGLEPEAAIVECTVAGSLTRASAALYMPGQSEAQVYVGRVAVPNSPPTLAGHEFRLIYRYLVEPNTANCQGLVVLKENGEWVEYRPAGKTPQCSPATFHFKQVSADQAWITLFDGSRALFLRVPAAGNGWVQWGHGSDGPWVNLQQVEKVVQ